MWSTLWSVVSRATLFDWLFLAGALLALLYYVGISKYDYFAQRGVPFTKPKLPFMGNVWGMFLGTSALTDAIKDLYDKGAGHRAFGFFDFRTPMYMIRDPELLKKIAVKDFEHFINHRKPPFDDVDPVLIKNLFSLRGQRWREMRATLSPAFTSSKLKGMFQLMTTCGSQVADYVRERHAQEGKEAVELDVKDLFTRFANDVIATTAFGIGVDSLKQPENEFYRMGKETTTPSFSQILIVVGYMIIPKIMKLLGFQLVPKKPMDFFRTLVHGTIRERQKQGIVRADMLQLLMQAREGHLKADAEDEEVKDLGAKKSKLEDDDITAQAIIFFFAGFETVSTAMCFSTYALATHPDVQSRLREEVDDVMARTGGKLTYDDVCSMKYLDMVINESLRLYPPGVITDRECEISCSIPGENGQPPIHFVVGDKVWVPSYGIHRDPQYWSDPDKFDPERFSDENKPNIRPFTYLPFGLGPRICIGQRFALLEMKIALIHLVANFELSRKDGMDGTIKYAKGMKMMPASGNETLFKPRIQPAAT